MSLDVKGNNPSRKILVFLYPTCRSRCQECCVKFSLNSEQSFSRKWVLIYLPSNQLPSRQIWRCQNECIVFPPKCLVQMKGAAPPSKEPQITSRDSSFNMIMKSSLVMLDFSGLSARICFKFSQHIPERIRHLLVPESLYFGPDGLCPLRISCTAKHDLH